jgi:DNA polymerase-3 subunit delta
LTGFNLPVAPEKAKKSDAIQNVYVIAGKDTSLVNAECDRLLDRLIVPADKATGLLNADADSVTAAEIMDELRTLPFLTGRRIVVLKNADKFISNNRELLETYFDSPSPTGVLVLTLSNFDSRTRLAKKLSQIGQFISVSQPSAAQLPARLRQYALEAHTKTLQGQASELLIELVGDELVRLYSEIDKLAVYVGQRKTITAEDVNCLVGHNRLFDAFDVINSLIARDTARAVDQLRRLFSQDRDAQYSFIGALAYHLRRMFTAKVMQQKGWSDWDIAKSLRIWYHADELFEQLRKTSLIEIGTLIQRLARADYEIKTGRATPRTVIEQLMVSMAAT